ncbi:MAG TPA: sugar ABC transporter permease [Treponemataceae bacterium]|jgi:multiple sugar transport system permease protein|nr:sugar ABC transporter permease [Spirochaetota bacterium]HOF11924.1 sugar ABC transporter permease [Treponemataceae bacterium]HOQ92425.1 sugar ABC transporter permease [Treponemataceae bacterium]HPM06614.1 sugar ABC transporter permease [Treponemataceae bacterium]HQC27406.1 sugar ABC transporter permease [Treponemataceae bacterium]
MTKTSRPQKKRLVDYSKWGYFFIAPFFIIYVIFSLIPLLSTFVYSFFESYRIGLQQVGPNFVGFANYKAVLESDFLKYTMNTLLLWILNFVPQILVSLVLAVWFTSSSLRLKGQPFFKTIIYMPNLIMASAFAMLFFALFSDKGPVNIILEGMDIEPIRFLTKISWTRALISIMNFLMWFGNTTILLMAGILGIDESLFEASRIDGASALQTFFKITMPLLMPIFIYVLITSMIGGIQMFDVPQILTNGSGNPNRTSMTLIMYLNRHLTSRNFGLGGAVSAFIFLMTSVLGFFTYRSLMSQYRKSPSRKS